MCLDWKFELGFVQVAPHQAHDNSRLSADNSTDLTNIVHFYRSEYSKHGSEGRLEVTTTGIRGRETIKDPSLCAKVWNLTLTRRCASFVPAIKMHNNFEQGDVIHRERLFDALSLDLALLSRSIVCLNSSISDKPLAHGEVIVELFTLFSREQKHSRSNSIRGYTRIRLAAIPDPPKRVVPTSFSACAKTQ